MKKELAKLYKEYIKARQKRFVDEAKQGAPMPISFTVSFEDFMEWLSE